MLIHIDKKLIDRLKKESRVSSRKRVIHRFHKYKDSVQRMVNVMYKRTYAQPHAHLTPPKVEAFIILEGRAVIIEFTKTGKIKNSVILDSKGDARGTEIKPKTIHTIIPLSQITVFYEIKEGPYNKRKDKTFAKFAPREKDFKKGLSFNKKILEKLKIR